MLQVPSKQEIAFKPQSTSIFYTNSIMFGVKNKSMAVKWIAKLLVQKAISYMPYSLRINYFFQKHITRGAVLNDIYFAYKIKHAADHIRFFQEFHTSKSTENKIIFELGTGWYPIVPIAFFLCGARTIYTSDLYPWLTAGNVLKTIQAFIVWHEKGEPNFPLPMAQAEKWAVLYQLVKSKPQNLESLLAAMHIKYMTTQADIDNIPAGNTDMVCSNNTLEHIEEQHLVRIINFMAHQLCANGISSHFIDMTDHFSHSDVSISHYNFLKFKHWQWKLMDNTLQMQNRLRLKQYLKIFQESGFQQIHIETETGNLQWLKQNKLAYPFSEMKQEDVAITHAYVVSRKETEEGKNVNSNF